eukprot:m.61400 g.61400  ORF g.61400 m.61400 type:complete len:111 (-) comp13340_c1_seq1:367-699(-)
MQVDYVCKNDVHYVAVDVGSLSISWSVVFVVPQDVSSRGFQPTLVKHVEELGILLFSISYVSFFPTFFRSHDEQASQQNACHFSCFVICIFRLLYHLTSSTMLFFVLIRL